MKKMNVFAGLFLTLVFLTFVLTAAEKSIPTKTTVKMPDNVKVIVDKSCFGCHNTGSQNEDAKEKLDFKTLDELSMIKKIGKLKYIWETIEEGEMPPKRFLERNPDKKLTEDEVKILTEWAKKEAALLIKQ